MRKSTLVALLVLLAVFSVTSASYAASCGPNAPGWNCTTSVTRTGDTTKCSATATSPGGAYNIYMYGGGPGGKALHTSAGAYYGTASTKSCNSSTCSITFTYTGTARPTLCNWLFSF